MRINNIFIFSIILDLSVLNNIFWQHKRNPAVSTLCSNFAQRKAIRRVRHSHVKAISADIITYDITFIGSTMAQEVGLVYLHINLPSIRFV